jgi:hypothetical protein
MKEVDGVKPGLDLDDSCTCQRDLRDGAAPCETPSATRMACDFDGGVDDSFGALSLQYSPFLTSDFDLAGTENRAIASGLRTFLIYVNGYNGKADDPLVGVSIIMSGGLYDSGRCGDPATTVPDSGRETLMHAPRWDGCDRWSASHGMVQGNYPNRKTVVVPGYVANHTLVAHLPPNTRRDCRHA